MTTNTAELLERVQRFQLDEPGAAIPFSTKLAKENNWSREYALRAIEEYKRFTFLAIASGHPVSPPEDVDQVWHLHLCYSENYWNVFCPQVLGRPFHHGPGKGGQADRDKFKDWYARTYESYQKFFGDYPPRDIWPDPESRWVGRHDFARVDRAKNWVIQKPKLDAKKIFAAGLLPTVLLCTGATVAQGANIFDWEGRSFLGFFFLASVVAFASTFMLRRILRPAAPAEPLQIPDLDPYAIAYLNGGRILAVNTALANLIRQNALAVQDRTNRLVRTEKALTFSHEIEEALYRGTSSKGTSLPSVRSSAKPAVDRIVQSLISLRLLLPPGQSFQAALIASTPILIVLAVGIVKIGVGISRDRPVGFLAFLCILLGIAVVIALCSRNARTRFGDAVLNRLQSTYRGRPRISRHPATMASGDFAMTMGLFGMAALASTDLQHLQTSLQQPNSSSSGCGGSCGGSCGSLNSSPSASSSDSGSSSSDSGSSGDSGSSDGGGGGGCGGCGGGGGGD